MITGEARKYNTQTAAFDAPSIARPFDLKGGGLGAFELVARYSVADLNFRAGAQGTAPGPNSIRGGREQNITVGLNWWPNPVVRFMFDFQHVNINRLSPCTNTGSGVNNTCTGTASGIASWLTPVGAKIGQSYNAIAIRSQFAF
jgi:phosphate-selective porin OprO/OprP